MDLLAPIFAYLGTVAGVVVAVALSYNALIYKPLYAPRMPQATTIVAAKSSAPTMPKAKARHKAEIRSSAEDAKTRIAAPQRFSRAKQRSMRLANERWRRRLAREWAYRPFPRAPYALGYAEGPRAPFGNRGFE